MSAKKATRTRSGTTVTAAPPPAPRSHGEILAELQRLVQELVEIERQLAKDGGV